MRVSCISRWDRVAIGAALRLAERGESGGGFSGAVSDGQQVFGYLRRHPLSATAPERSPHGCLISTQERGPQCRGPSVGAGVRFGTHAAPHPGGAAPSGSLVSGMLVASVPCA